jgi:hypothetical protein
LDLPLLKLDALAEHADGRVAPEKAESEDMEENGSDEDGGNFELGSVESKEDVDADTPEVEDAAKKTKVPHSEKPQASKCVAAGRG